MHFVTCITYPLTWDDRGTWKQTVTELVKYISCLIGFLKVQDCDQKRSLPDPILSQLKPVNILQSMPLRSNSVFSSGSDECLWVIQLKYKLHCYMPHANKISSFGHPNNSWWTVQSWIFSLGNFVPPPSLPPAIIICSGPRIPISTLLPHTLTLFYSYGKKSSFTPI